MTLDNSHRSLAPEGEEPWTLVIRPNSGWFDLKLEKSGRIAIYCGCLSNVTLLQSINKPYSDLFGSCSNRS